MKRRSQKDELENTRKSVIWIILTNSYFDPLPEPISQEHGGTIEEEEKVPIIESATSAQRIGIIDTKRITGKYTEYELLRVVVERTVRETRRENQLGELVGKFQSLFIVMILLIQIEYPLILI